MKKIIILAVTAFIIIFSVPALDYGLILSQGVEGGGILDRSTYTMETGINYKGNLITRFSHLFGNSGELYASAGLAFNHEHDNYPVPELLRTEFSWRWNGLKFTAGRMQYTAPLEYVANGLFDGFQASYATDKGTFYTGLWYTGFLFKRSSNIAITLDDSISYYDAVDYNNFVNTYFASRRLVTAIGWEHPAIAQIVRAKATFIQQIDLNYRDGHLHSRYFTARAGISVRNLLFELGGVFQMADSDNDSGTNFTFDMGVYWDIPFFFPSRISFTGYFSPEDEKKPLGKFIPINAKPLGEIEELPVTGITMFTLEYTARIFSSFSFTVGTSYYMLNTLSKAVEYGFFLNNEFYTRLIWSPASDWQFNLGGGIALPGSWKITIGAVLALL